MGAADGGHGGDQLIKLRFDLAIGQDRLPTGEELGWRLHTHGGQIMLTSEQLQDKFRPITPKKQIIGKAQG